MAYAYRPLEEVWDTLTCEVGFNLSPPTWPIMEMTFGWDSSSNTGLSFYFGLGATEGETEAYFEFYVAGYPEVIVDIPFADITAMLTDIDRFEISISLEDGVATAYMGGQGPYTIQTSGVFPPPDGGIIDVGDMGTAADETRIFSVNTYKTPAGLPGHFDYNYSVPDDLVKFLYVADENLPVERHGPCYMSNDSEVTLTYLWDIEDATKFPPHFIKALVAKLRSDLAIPLGGRNARRTNWDELYVLELERAISTEGTSESPNQEKWGVNTDSDPWVGKARY